MSKYTPVSTSNLNYISESKWWETDHSDKRVLKISFFSVLAGIAPGQPHHPHDFQGQAGGIYIGPSLSLKLTVNLSEVDTYYV